MSRALRTLDRVVHAALGAIGIALVAGTAAQILARSLLGWAYAGASELALVLLAWASFLAGYLALRRGAHIVLRFGAARSLRARRAVSAACALYCALVAWKGLELLEAMRGIRFAALPAEQTWLYAALPAGAVLMLVALAADLLQPTPDA